MKVIISIVTIIGTLGLTSGAWAECTRPAEPTIGIDGASATAEDIKAAYQKVMDYKEAIEGEDGFLKCLNAEEEALINQAEAEEMNTEEFAEQRQIIVQRHNAAVTSLQDVAAEFNLQYRAYKAEQGE